MALHVTESVPRKPTGRDRAFAPRAAVQAGRELRRAFPAHAGPATRRARSTVSQRTSVSRRAAGSPATVRRRRVGGDLGLLHPWPVVSHYQPVHWLFLRSEED